MPRHCTLELQDFYFVGILSAIWLLGGKRMPDGNRLRSYDTGRGLTAFILFAILAAAAGFVIPLVPGKSAGFIRG